MKFRILALAVIVFGLALATAVAADVAGKWISERPGRGGGEPMITTYNFKVEGTTLTGTVSSPMGGENPISDGKIEGDNISFSQKIAMQGNEMTLKYKGTVSGDEMKLNLEIEGMGGPGGGPGGKTFEVTLKRAK